MFLSFAQNRELSRAEERAFRECERQMQLSDAELAAHNQAHTDQWEKRRAIKQAQRRWQDAGPIYAQRQERAIRRKVRK